MRGIRVDVPASCLLRRFSGLGSGPHSVHPLHCRYWAAHVDVWTEISLLCGRHPALWLLSSGPQRGFEDTTIRCIDAVARWMASNRLKLNSTKTEFMWCCTYLENDSAFTLSDGTVNASVVVRNLGAYLDQSLLLKDHVSRLVRFCFYQLRRIKSVRRLLPTSVAIQLVNSFVISRVDN